MSERPTSSQFGLEISVKEGANQESRELIQFAYDGIPEHWKKLGGKLSVVVFAGRTDEPENKEIWELRDRADWFECLPEPGQKPDFSRAEIVYHTESRTIYVRDGYLFKRDDKYVSRGGYQVERDFLMTFAKMVWNLNLGSPLHDFCRKNFVPDYFNFYLGHVPNFSKAEIKNQCPGKSKSEIDKRYKWLKGEYTSQIAKSNFARIWQLYFFNMDYMERKMEEMIPLMKDLDTLIAS